MAVNLDKLKIEYLKSSLSISSYVGCTLGCKYCILSSLKFGLPKKITDESNLVEELCNHKFFIKGFTPISINNRTDPFLNLDIKKSTFIILDLLKKRKINKNPIFLITKRKLNKKDLEWLNNSKLNIYLFLSYSGSSKLVEPVNETFDEDFLVNLKKMKNIHKIHYWRPIIEGINDDDKTINRVLATASSVFDCSIVSGIRLSKDVINLLKKYTGVSFEYKEDQVTHKYLSEQNIQKILNLRDQKYPDYVLFRHTSCVVAYFEGIPDLNLRYLKAKNCIFGCTNKINCTNSINNCNKKIIDKNLKVFKNEEITYTFDNEAKQLNVNASLSQEEVTYLRHNLGFQVNPVLIISSPSEAEFVK